MVVIFNPFGFKMLVWYVKQFLHVHRICQSEYEQNVEPSYKYLFVEIYISNIASIIFSIVFPYLKSSLDKLTRKRTRSLYPSIWNNLLKDVEI